MEINGQIWILYHALAKKQTKPLSPVQMQKLLLSLKLRDVNDFFIWTPGWPEWQSLVNFIKSPQTFFILTSIPTPPQKKEEQNIPLADLLDEHTRSRILDMKVYNDHETNELFVDYEGDEQFTLVDTKKHAPNGAEEYGYFSNDFRAEDIDVNATPSLKDKSEPVAGSNRRVSDRHNFKLEIILISKSGKTFKTFSQNISLGGTLLQDPVPKDFLNGEIEMMITSRLDDKNKDRLHFRGKIVGDFRNPMRLTFKEASEHMMAKLEVLLNTYVLQLKDIEKNRKAKS